MYVCSKPVFFASFHIENWQQGPGYITDVHNNFVSYFVLNCEQVPGMEGRHTEHFIAFRLQDNIEYYLLILD